MEPVMIELEPDEYQALATEAKRQRRTPEQQAAVSMLQGLEMWNGDDLDVDEPHKVSRRTTPRKRKAAGQDKGQAS